MRLKHGKKYETADGVVYRVRKHPEYDMIWDVSDDTDEHWDKNGKGFGFTDLIRRHYTKPQPAHKLKSCPFCCGCLEMVSVVHYRHPKGKCVISGHVFPKRYIGQWNTRVAQPDPRDEVIAKLVEALENVTAILQAAIMAGKIKCADQYRIGGVYLQNVSDTLDASDAALASAKAVQHG